MPPQGRQSGEERSPGERNGERNVLDPWRAPFGLDDGCLWRADVAIDHEEDRREPGGTTSEESERDGRAWGPPSGSRSSESYTGSGGRASASARNAVSDARWRS